MRYCVECGTAVSDDDRYCEGCGVALDHEEATEAQPLHDRKRGVDFAFYYPAEGGLKAVAISGLLVIGGILLLPLLPLAGYAYRVGRSAAHGDEEPPQYGDWLGLTVDGVRYTFMYWGLTIAFYAAFVGVGLLGDALGLGGVTSLVLLLMLALFVYGHPAFLAAFMGSRGVIGALTDGRALALLGSGFYLKAFAWSILLGIALGIVANFLFFVFPWAWAYVLLAYSAYWGYVYHQAAERGIVGPPAERA